MQLNYDRGPSEQQLVFRINDNGVGPELLEQVFLERGWIEYDEEIHGADGWNIWWRTTKFRTGEYTSLLPWQWINHFPSCTLITKKDALCRNIRKMRVAHGFHVFNFCPHAFNLPNDYTKFVSEYANVKQQARQEARATWICKPAESSRGRGIFVFSELADLQYDCNAVVQQYIADPLLIGGYKFDIRVYVAIPSFYPLQIYIHEEGLVRFSTEKYDLTRLDNVFSHLTNTSINKHSPGYMTDKEEVGHGCKWTISQLRRYFLQNNINDAHIWQQVTNIIILTILIQAPSAPKISNCFELYGFDILIDQSLKAWLLEVNFSPSLAYDCQVDVVAKKAMLHDLMALVDFSDANLELTPTAQSPTQPRDGHTARTTASTSSYSSSHHTSSSTHGSGRYSRTIRHSFSERRNNSQYSSSTKLHSNSPGRRQNYNVRTDPNENEMSSRAHRTDSTSLTSVKPRKVPRLQPQSSSTTIICYSETYEPGAKENARSKSEEKLFQSKEHVNTLDKHESSEDNEKQQQQQQQQHPSSPKDTEKIGNVTTEPMNPDGCDDYQISNNSDSGLSSMSSNCDNQGNDNNNGLTQVSPSNIKGGSTPVSFAMPQEAAATQLSPGFGTEVIDKLQDTQEQRRPSFQNEQGVIERGVEALDIDIAEDGHPDGINFEMKFVKGNMRGQGLKQVISPIPSLNLKKEKMNTFVSKGTRERSDSRAKVSLKDRLTRGKSQNQSSIFNGANAYRDKHAIPRNLSMPEASRFHHHFHHHFLANHSPGKNGKAPLTKIPKKKVGRFFLVFPFNEETQKLSTGKLEPRLIIKELMRRGAGKKKQREGSPSGVDEADTIWVPIKSAD